MYNYQSVKKLEIMFKGAFQMIKAAVVGATGYAGAALLSILNQHPRVRIVGLTSRSYALSPISEIYPSFLGSLDLILAADMDDLPEADVYFFSLPAGESASLAEKALEKGAVSIDLGSDFRLHSLKTYQSWYGEHKAPHLLEKAVYGLPEVRKEEIKEAKIIANPGCYPTSVLLPLVPLLQNEVIEKEIIIDAKSGVSGAGRSLKAESLFVEVNENMNPYAVAHHRHTPEIEQELSWAAGKELKIVFTPHLVPLNRGILSTIYARPRRGFTAEDIKAVYYDFYKDAPFVRLLPPGAWPKTKWVVGTNNCWFNFTIDERTNNLIIASVIDNLIKGAAGQAVQNMNLVFGLKETTGLKLKALVP